MFKVRLNTNFSYVDKFGIRKTGRRTTTYGNLYNGDSIAIDNYYKDGKIVEKRFVIWNDFMQKIITKIIKPNGKGFNIVS